MEGLRVAHRLRGRGAGVLRRSQFHGRLRPDAHDQVPHRRAGRGAVPESPADPRRAPDSSGPVGYTVWCNDAGMVLDDGTLFHLREVVTTGCAPRNASLDWLLTSALGARRDHRVDETAEVAALAVQGPTSCAALRAMGLAGLETLKPFGLRHYPFDGGELMVSPHPGSPAIWATNSGSPPPTPKPCGTPCSLPGATTSYGPWATPALELARIEAGFIQAGVDFVPAEQVLRHGRARSPFELGLDWLVDFDKGALHRPQRPAARTGARLTLPLPAPGCGRQQARARILHPQQEGARPSAMSPPPPGAPRPSATWRSPPWRCLGADRRMNCTPEIYLQPGNCAGPALRPRCRIIDGHIWDPPRRRQTPAPDF